ncbi:hypothetical protein AB0B66_35850 [Catellatospora sp. NPDC049111]|uniref:hypothetical protein n=1 Tax=Catellatospora sp. NPDC049111 TaxID=3155271 RepID=UPI0033D936C7
MNLRHTARRALPWAASAALVAAIAVSPTGAQAATVVTVPTVTRSYYGDYPVGRLVSFTFQRGADGEAPVRFSYDLNGQVRTVKATGGKATITLAFTGRRVNVLRVSAIAADGTQSGATYDIMAAMTRTPAQDKDVDGDMLPDLLLAGGNGRPTGIWQATLRNPAAFPGQLKTPAVNVGAYGLGYGGPETSDGATLVTGSFLHTGFSDVLGYHTGGFNAGGGALIGGSGDGSVLDTRIGQRNLYSGYLSDLNGDNPLQLANAYNAAGADVDGHHTDDLIATVGSPANGYHLHYYVGSYAVAVGPQLALTTKTPADDMAWQDWTIATAQQPTADGSPGTAMYLWHRASGRLVLWKDIRVTDHQDGTGSITHTAYEVAVFWNTGADLAALVAADFTGDGSPDLWAVRQDGKVTAYAITGLTAAGPATVTPGPQQSLF